jgi:ribosomal protein S18 acetylase RimI-like enzyme
VPTVATADATVALAWAEELFGAGSPLAFLLAPRRFVLAERRDASMAITLEGDEVFGAAMGPNPPLRAEWDSCSLARPGAPDRFGSLAPVDEWDFYSRRTQGAPDSGVEKLDDDAFVEAFLNEHAPSSAVWPSSPEIVEWLGVRDDEGRVVALGAIVRWESGEHVLSSVATATGARGRGHAERLVLGVLGYARALGIEGIGLGVHHSNDVAQRLYVRCGFVRRAEFVAYSKTGIARH